MSTATWMPLSAGSRYTKAEQPVVFSMKRWAKEYLRNLSIGVVCVVLAWAMQYVSPSDLLRVVPGFSPSTTSAAIVSTGVDYNAPDLRDRIVKGLNFSTNTEDPMDDVGVGTQLARDALPNISGSIVPLKVNISATRYIPTDLFAAAIRTAIDNYHVGTIYTNTHWFVFSQTLHDALQYACLKGVPIVGMKIEYDAAGNVYNPADPLAGARDFTCIGYYNNPKQT